VVGTVFAMMVALASSVAAAGRPDATDPAAAAEPRPAATVRATLRVQVPASTPARDRIHVAGDFQDWNPGSPSHALTRTADGRWVITLELPPGRPIELKFTRGSWEKVEKGPAGEEIPNRVLNPEPGATYDFKVASWRDQAGPAPARPSTITGHVESFSDDAFLGGRRCWVYLPPGYERDERRYPVLYMHDGQNLFDDRTSFAGEWRIDETCERMIGAGEIAPLIVVGIENAGLRRCDEYTPWPTREAGSTCSGGGADLYLRAIRDTLIPLVNRRYRARTGPESTWMAGSSLGGLITAYAALSFGGTFGRVAAVSPSYWWAERRILAHAAAPGPLEVFAFYQDMGTDEKGSDQDANGVNDLIDDLRVMERIVRARGLSGGGRIQSVEAAGHRHSERYWAERAPEILRFLTSPTDGRAEPKPR
jgi:pullulanase